MNQTQNTNAHDEIQRITTTIQGLGFRGEGYASPEPGLFISVPHTLPGDEVEILRGPFHRGRAWGQVQRWIQKSKQHADPRCAHYDACSGCALRHMPQEEERTWKLTEARAILERYGPPTPSDFPLEWVSTNRRSNHRGRGSFRVSVTAEGKTLLGLRSTDLDGKIANIRDCAAQSETWRATMLHIGALLDAHLDLAQRLSAVEIRTSSTEIQVLFHVEQPLLPSHVSLLQGWNPGQITSMATLEKGGEPQVLRGKATLSLEIPVGEKHVLIEVPHSSWYHTNPETSHALTSWVRSTLQPARHPFVLDLCCGIGTAGLSLAPHVTSLLCVDEDRKATLAIEAATQHPDANLNHVRTRAGRVGAVLRKLRRELVGKEKPTGALINPMRKPLGKDQLKDLAPLGIQDIVYLGPAPVSAARDAATLAKMGYKLKSGAVIDLHPATGQFMLGLHMVHNAKGERE